MDDRIRKLEQDVALIKERNLRVEADKAWETSSVRIFSVALITYFVASLVLYYVGAINFLTGALVPTLGYLLSVQSLPVLKQWWIKNIYKT